MLFPSGTTASRSRSPTCTTHDAVANAVRSAEAVLSALGLPFGRKPITVYSDGVGNIVAGMSGHGIKRLVVISSSATEPRHHADGGFLLNRVPQPVIVARIGKTVYADMRRMEQLVAATDLAWTVMPPSGRFDISQITDCRLDENHAPGGVHRTLRPCRQHA